MTTRELDPIAYPGHVPDGVELHRQGWTPASLRNAPPETGRIDWQTIARMVAGCIHYNEHETVGDEPAVPVKRDVWTWVKIAGNRKSRAAIDNVRAGRSPHVDPARYDLHAERVGEGRWDYYMRVKPPADVPEGPERDAHRDWIGDSMREWRKEWLPEIKAAEKRARIESGEMRWGR